MPDLIQGVQSILDELDSIDMSFTDKLIESKRKAFKKEEVKREKSKTKEEVKVQLPPKVKIPNKDSSKKHEKKVDLS